MPPEGRGRSDTADNLRAVYSPVPGYAVLVLNGLDVLYCKNDLLPMAATQTLCFPHTLGVLSQGYGGRRMRIICAFLPASLDIN